MRRHNGTDAQEKFFCAVIKLRASLGEENGLKLLKHVFIQFFRMVGAAGERFKVNDTFVPL